MTDQTELNLEEAIEKGRRRASSKERGQPTNEKPDDAATVVHLPGIYAKAARKAAADEGVDQATSSGTLENKTRRIVHFVGEYKDWRGRKRWKSVVTLCPGEKAWIAHTVDPETFIPKSWATFGPNVDPYEALSEAGETVIDTCYAMRARDGLKGRWHGWTILTSVDYCKFLIAYDVARAREPHQLKQWLLNEQPPTRAPSAGKAFKQGLRAFLGDYVTPGY